MSRRETSGRRRLSVPEVLQSSLMDCGPAALKAVLEGFGIQVVYDALRERCQTDVDGTSIDALAELSRECGLACHRVLMPMDHLLLPEARSLPAIITVRSSGGAFHFVVVWRRWGSFVQIMDPSSGRKWRSGQQLLGEMPVFTLPVSAAHFRRWARSAPAQAAFGARLRRLGLPRAGAEQLLADAQRDSSWRSIGRLDAALRMTDALVCRPGPIRAGHAARSHAGARARRGALDPAVQLWDQSLLDNLTYGDDQNAEQKLPGALAASELLDVLSQLSAGLQSGLGESGVRVSGGQGQRVRIGRALMRDEPRLVLLDEPFRGLERRQRQALLAHLREHWRGSTLLFVSHDVDDTSDLEHVIVFEAGRVVETGDPRLLLQSRGGHAHGCSRGPSSAAQWTRSSSARCSGRASMDRQTRSSSAGCRAWALGSAGRRARGVRCSSCCSKDRGSPASSQCS